MVGVGIGRAHGVTAAIAAIADLWRGVSGALPAIFVSRFLPGLRAVVPVFVGATHQPWARVAPPIAVASGIWYGGLVWLGLWAGQNLDALSNALGRVNSTLAIGAGAVTALVALWWMMTRRRPHE